MKLIIFFTLTTAIGLVFAQEPSGAKDIVEKAKKCYAEDNSAADRCLEEFFTEIRPYMVDGIPEYNVLSIQPIHIAEIPYPEDGALIQGKAVVRNVTVNGIGNYTVKNIDIDSEKSSLTFELHLDRLEADGVYEMDGTILLLPVKGKGRLSLNLTDINTNLTATLGRDAKGIKIDKLDMEFEGKHVMANMQNIFGHEEVSEAVNNVINVNAQEIIKELKPTMRALLADFVKSSFENLVRELPEEAFNKN